MTNERNKSSDTVPALVWKSEGGAEHLFTDRCTFRVTPRSSDYSAWAELQVCTSNGWVSLKQHTYSSQGDLVDKEGVRHYNYTDLEGKYHRSKLPTRADQGYDEARVQCKLDALQNMREYAEFLVNNNFVVANEAELVKN